MVGTSTSPAPPGRPRDPRLDRAITDAAIDLLEEHGYSATTIKAVAERAGTTTAAVYRRWGSKAELVLDAVFRTEGADVVADTSDFEADLRSMVRWSLEKFARPVGRAALGGLLAEPPRRAVGVSGRLTGIWAQMDGRLRRAVEDGDVDAGVEVDALVAAIAGPAMLLGVTLGQRAVDERTVEALVTVVLDGIHPRRPCSDEGARGR
jgi:AcrR family transcriptional regulator